MLRSATRLAAAVLLISAATATTDEVVATSDKLQESSPRASLLRALQSFHFGASDQLGNPVPTHSPAPTPSASANDDYYYGDFPTTSPWPTATAWPTETNDDNGGVDQGGDMATTTATMPSGNSGGANVTNTVPYNPPVNVTTPATAAPPDFNIPGGSPPDSSNVTTVVPPPVVPAITSSPARAPVASTETPTVSANNGGSNYYDDDVVPTISPAPTPPDGPEPGYSPDNSNYSPWVRTLGPTVHYVPPNDDILVPSDDATPMKDWEEMSQLEKAEAELDEIRRDKNVQIVSIVFGVTGFLLLLFVAHQLIENPDGFFGKLCRCLLACVRIICWPCRFLCCRSARARDRRTHQLVHSEPSTYGYSHDLELT